jgi:excisionase family DNA binding protein
MTARPLRLVEDRPPERAPFMYSTSAAAKYLGVSPGSVRRWADLGFIRSRRSPGGQRRFSQTDLDGFARDS